MTNSSDADLLDRIQRIEDKEAIRDRWYDYFYALDSLDWPGLADVFTEDGTLEIVGLVGDMASYNRQYHGRESIIEDFYRTLTGPALVPEQGQHYTGHYGVNMTINLDGDTATTLAYFFEILGSTYVCGGNYQHRLVREADAWRFKFLRISTRYFGTLDVTDLSGMSLQNVRRLPIPD
jgi:hypothetical protein